jgi:hypothetical protein
LIPEGSAALDEREWNACKVASRMLRFLNETGRGSARKLVLFSVARWRLAWQEGVPPFSRHLVDTAEAVVDGLGSRKRLRKLLACRHHETHSRTWQVDSEAARVAICCIDGTGARWSIVETLSDAGQKRLLHDIFGPLPFRPVHLDRSLLTWRDGVIPRMAQTIYEERAFDRMPILADALEEAGLTDQDILGHCRQQGTIHVRGCFVVDLLLGRA